MRKKEYRRWDDETEMNMEEQLTLEDHQFDYEHGRDTPTSTMTTTTTTFSQPSVTSHIQRKKGHRRIRIKEKVQIVCLSATILLVGFITGFHIGIREQSSRNSVNNNSSSSSVQLLPTQQDEHELPSTKFAYDEALDGNGGMDPSTNSFPSSSSSQETNEPSSPPLIQPPSDIRADNIREILRRMSQKGHGVGGEEGKSMAMAIRDLWRSYGLSVRVEQHSKTVLTKVTGFSYAEVLNKNGSVVFRTSGDQPNPRPMIAFSPAADLNGTLIYGHYGRIEDFEFLKSSRIILNRSIALIRFGGLHPSKVAAVASAYGIQALLFYPDPQDYGPLLPHSAVRHSSLLTLGQIHEYQKHKSKFIIPAHTISPNDAEQLLRSARQGNWMKRAPPSWQGGLKTTYFLGLGVSSSSPPKHYGSQPQQQQPSLPPPVQIRLRIFNEPKMSSIYNVVAAIPGWESDRYVIIGCMRDGWSGGAGEPGFGISLLSELARTFSNAVQKGGYKPRRSVLFVVWDTNLGLTHWLQEHQFEIATRTVAYIDVSRSLRGNQTLHVHSSPILNSVARKAISTVIHGDFSSSSQSQSQFNPPASEDGGRRWRNGSTTTTTTPIYFSSLVTSDESSYAFLGTLGIPVLRYTFSNSPKGYDYPLFHTSFDTFENFVNSVDLPSMKRAETLGKIMLETILLLADSSVLPINVEDYVVEIQAAFGNFMTRYNEDLHKANLSIAYLQAAVMRLEVIGDNFRTEMVNRTVINPEYDTLPAPSPSPRTIKSKKALLHRIINDKLMEIDRAFLSRSFHDEYKHQVLGFTYDMEEIRINGSTNTDNNNMSMSLNHYFPKLKEALECGRRAEELEEQSGIKDISLSRGGREIKNSYFKHGGVSSRRIRARREKKFRTRDPDAFPTGIGTYLLLDSSICHDWHLVAAQRIVSLTRALDFASGVLQSPLLPEESE